MNAYCTREDVKFALAPSGSDASTGNTPISMPDSAYDDAINAAQGMIDTYVASRYQIVVDVEALIPVEPTDPPTVPTPDPISVLVAKSPIRYWTRDVAAYYLWLTYNRGRNLDEDDPVRLRFFEVRRLLEKVSEGKLDLDLPPSASSDSSSTFVVHNLYEGQLFGPEDFCLSPMPPRAYGGYNG